MAPDGANVKPRHSLSFWVYLCFSQSSWKHWDRPESIIFFQCVPTIIWLSPLCLFMCSDSFILLQFICVSYVCSISFVFCTRLIFEFSYTYNSLSLSKTKPFYSLSSAVRACLPCCLSLHQWLIHLGVTEWNRIVLSLFKSFFISAKGNISGFACYARHALTSVYVYLFCLCAVRTIWFGGAAVASPRRLTCWTTWRLSLLWVATAGRCHTFPKLCTHHTESV